MSPLSKKPSDKAPCDPLVTCPRLTQHAGQGFRNPQKELRRVRIQSVRPLNAPGMTVLCLKICSLCSPINSIISHILNDRSRAHSWGIVSASPYIGNIVSQQTFLRACCGSGRREYQRKPTSTATARARWAGGKHSPRGKNTDTTKGSGTLPETGTVG